MLIAIREHVDPSFQTLSSSLFFLLSRFSIAIKRKLSHYQENTQERHNQHQLSISDHHQPSPPQPPGPPINEANKQDHEATRDLRISPSQSVRSISLHAIPRIIYPHSQEMDQNVPQQLLQLWPSILQRLLPRADLQPDQVTRRMEALRQVMLRLQRPPAPPPPPSTPDHHAGSSTAANQNNQELMVAPHTWATTRRAKVHGYGFLLLEGVNTIHGWVQCKNCENTYRIDYNFKEKFIEIASFIAGNENKMGGMDPSFWEHATPPSCNACQKYEFAVPIIEIKKKDINWLFLFLGQWIGYCSHEQLKYFCKHNGLSPQGTKTELRWRTYLSLLLQLLS